MTDPMTNLEIQDVLSSIRRLVSEDNRHRAERERAREAGEAAVPAPAEAGKLMLTEALRVPEAEMPEAEMPEAEAPAAESAAAESAGAEAAGGAAGEDAPDAHAADMDAADAGVPDSGLASEAPVAPWVGVRSADAGGEALDQGVTGIGRFAAEEAVPALAETETAGGDTWEAAGDTAEAVSLEDTIAELEAAVAGIGGEFEPDGSEVVRARAVDAELEEAFEEGFAVDLAAEEEEALALAQPVTSGAVGAEALAFPAEADAPDGLAGRPEPVGAVPAEPAMAEAEAREAGTPKPGTAEPGAAATGPDSVAEPAVPEEAPWNGAASDAMPAEPAPAFAHSVAAWRGAAAASRIEAAPIEAARPSGLRRLTLTAADAVTDGPAPWDRGDAPPAEPEAGHGTAEPGGAGQGGAGQSLDTAPGLASALADESPGSAPEGGEAEGEGSIFGPGEDGLIDMDMLRDIVAEIIREELQGPLGERITRNVRMLVRREINRALEARGLE